MQWRIIPILIGCVFMIGSVVGINRTMGGDIFMKPYPKPHIEKYGAAVAIGLPILLFLGCVIVIFGYIWFDEDRKRRGSGIGQRKKWRKKYRKNHQNIKKS
jgi:hypothetical protein